MGSGAGHERAFSGATRDSQWWVWGVGCSNAVEPALPTSPSRQAGEASYPSPRRREGGDKKKAGPLGKGPAWKKRKARAS
ncbi:hypothetical protein EBBID32_19340 [Sphingobium indicum BiD32]|uniref:Uncharacterized protein n=1 Tax=Sphingobium indicum BiD32 TaxID=1301087 RepID=N1MQ82_9SPHN|nr:hypothetical protein EBBID32_19340 [Sphingobium indicum BiD32]